jgi:hypothetical protein
MTDPENNRTEQFNKLHEKLWGSTGLSDFPLPYREAVNIEMRQATLIVLDTMDKIEVWRNEAKSDNKFKPDEQLIAFCKSLHAMSPEEVGGTGSVRSTVAKIAADKVIDDFDDNDWKNIKILKESLAKSVKTGGASPYKTSWGSR